MRINIRHRYTISAFLVALNLLAFPAILGLSGCEDDNFDRHIPTPITKAAGAVLSWSPDGQWIAIGWFGDYMAVPRGIYLIRPDGSDFQYFFAFNEYAPILDICWSPNGEWLAFAAGPPYAGSEIFKIKATGDSLTRLTFTGENYECGWAPSDTLIAFRYSGGTLDQGIWLMDLSGDNQRLVVAHGGDLEYAPNDSIIYMKSINADSGMMAIMNPSDSGNRIIMKWMHEKPFRAYDDPAISNDGQEIIISIDNQIWKTTKNGADLQKLTGSGGCFPDWSPDGQYIVYNEWGGDPMGGTIWIMNDDGSQKRLLIDWKDTIPLAKFSSSLPDGR